MTHALKALIPMFVAMDPIGGVPYFLGLTSFMTSAERLKVLVSSIITANIALLAFLLTGHVILKAMGITMNDFEVAGGIIILALSIRDVLSSGPLHEEAGGLASTQAPRKNVGVVPLGIPLLAGPSAFTTEILLLHHFGLWLTLGSVVLNTLLTAAIFSAAHALARFLRPTLLEAGGRFTSLILGAFGVMMVREGLGIRRAPLP